jgi:hypothetical protein
VPYRSTPYGHVFDARWQMLTGRDRLALALAAKIIMEAAIPMSKVGPAVVSGA